MSAENAVRNNISLQRFEYVQEWKAIKEKLKDFYFGRQFLDDYLTGPANEWGFKRKKDGRYKVPPVTCNITKKIIDKISLIYKRAPERYFIVDKKKIESEYSELFSKNMILNVGLKRAERFKNLLHHILYRPIYYAESNGWLPFIETEYTPHFAEGNPLYPKAYSIPIKRNPADIEVKDKEQWYMYWSDTEFYYYNEDGDKKTKLYENQDDWQGVNKYGIIPFVEMIYDIPIDEYRSNGALTLVNANQSINVNLMNINMMIMYQGHNIFIGKGMDVSDAVDVSSGAEKVLCTGSDGDKDIHALNLDPKIEKSMNVIHEQIKLIAWTYNLSIEASLEQKGPASGFSLIIKNIDLSEAREDDIEMAKMQEKKLYQVIARMHKVHNIKPRIKEDQDLFVNFREIDLPINQSEEIERWRFELEINATSVIRYLMAKEPDLSLEEAEQIWEENKKYNGKYSRLDLFKEAQKTLEVTNE